MSSSTLSTNKPIDKENTIQNIGKVIKSSDLATTNDHNINTIKSGLQNLTINHQAQQQSSHKRRALGDVKNISSRPSLSLNQQNFNKKQTTNELDGKKSNCLKQQQQQFDEIECTDSRQDQIDHFNDIMNQTTKLSNMLMNTKPITYLPVASVGTNFEIYNDKFHLDHVPNDKKFRKLINKEIKSSRHDAFNAFQIYNDNLVNIEDGVFVPPNDW